MMALRLEQVKPIAGILRQGPNKEEQTPVYCGESGGLLPCSEALSLLQSLQPLLSGVSPELRNSCGSWEVPNCHDIRGKST
jgi:hypothetical protein